MGKEVTKGSARNIGVGVSEHVGDNIWLFGVWEVMAFIEIVVDKGDREEHNLGKVVTKFQTQYSGSVAPLAMFCVLSPICPAAVCFDAPSSSEGWMCKPF